MKGVKDDDYTAALIEFYEEQIAEYKEAQKQSQTEIHKRMLQKHIDNYVGLLKQVKKRRDDQR